MASHPMARSRLEHFCKCWPLFVILFLVILYFSHLDLYMSESVTSKSMVQSSVGSLPPREMQKLPLELSMALIHYASTNITPQQTNEEIMVTAEILGRRSPCNFLVFGLGFDSLLWASLNYKGNTLFLEEDQSWIAQVSRKHPQLKAYHVNYTTYLTEADRLLVHAREEDQQCRPIQDLVHSRCKLALRNLPTEVYDTEWDVIMIDAPRGYIPEAPGRMTAIFSVAVMARRGKRRTTDILLHDVDRPVEKAYSSEFLCAKNLVAEVGRLWRFEISTQGSTQLESNNFCY